jgi:hypothetical protein
MSARRERVTRGTRSRLATVFLRRDLRRVECDQRLALTVHSAYPPLRVETEGDGVALPMTVVVSGSERR